MEKCLIRAKGSDLVFLAFWEQVLGTPINLISCSILVQNIVNEYSKTSFVTNGKLHYFQTGKKFRAQAAQQQTVIAQKQKTVSAHQEGLGRRDANAFNS